MTQLLCIEHGRPCIYLVRTSTGSNLGIMSVSPTNKIFLNQDWRIYDMVVFGDSVAFCGKCSTGGLYGWFDLHNLIVGNTVTIRCWYYTQMERLKLLSIDYATPEIDVPEVCFVGEKKEIDTLFDCIVQNSEAFPSTFLMCGWAKLKACSLTSRYQVLEINKMSGCRVAFLIAAPCEDSIRYHIRKAQAGSLFSSMINNVHYYDFAENEVESDIYSVPVLDDAQLALAYLTFLDSTETRVRLVDINTMEIVESQKYMLKKQGAPLLMTFLRDKKQLVIKSDATIISSDPTIYNAFTILNLCQTSDYYTYFLYHYDGYRFNSIDNINKAFFVSTSRNHFYTQWNDMLYPPSPACPSLDKVKVSIIPNLVHHSCIKPLNTESSPIYGEILQFNPVQVTKISECNTLIQTSLNEDEDR